MERMNYLILINKQSKPVVIEVPEKSDFEYGINTNSYDFHEHLYEEAIESAIADESKHTHFKDEQEVINALGHSFGWAFFPQYYIGQTFKIPEGLRLSFEECEKPCSQTCMELGYCGQRSAILEKTSDRVDPKPTEAAEPVNIDIGQIIEVRGHKFVFGEDKATKEILPFKVY